jgi:uncharacterized protein (DUF885 family)
LVVLCGILTAAAVACGGSRAPAAPPERVPADTRAKALADAYLSAYFDRYPDQGTYFGVPGRRHDRLPDNSLESLKVWEDEEDAWLAEAGTIDPASIQSDPVRAAYAIAREALESSIGARVCRSPLWNVSQMTGWQVGFGYLVTIQPVGSDQARREALARWSALPGYLDTEVANLREGVRLKYTAPKLNVRIVIDQIDTLLGGKEGDSPFMSPVVREQDSAFGREYTALYRDRIAGALRHYRDFLEHEYLPAARDELPVAALPDGDRCYAASVRLFSSLPMTSREVHEIGLREMDHLTAEMSKLAARSYPGEISLLLQRFRSERQFMFTGRKELIDYSQAALSRAKRKAPGWFGLLPKSDVTIEPYPAYREKNAANEYNPPAEDGSRAGLFYINAYQAEKKSRSPAESTTFHETLPGHHLQMAIALERTGIHPIGRYIFNSGFVEGWALYAERLADEMGLYSSDLDRLGMLSSQAFRAARLVVDSGIHAMGWTRQRAIDYMLAHTSEAPDDIASEVDRYIIYPGQATAYLLGMLEIRNARTLAQQTLGPRFDMKAFHDRVLEDGAVPLTFLSAKIRSWAMIPP